MIFNAQRTLNKLLLFLILIASAFGLSITTNGEVLNFINQIFLKMAKGIPVSSEVSITLENLFFQNATVTLVLFILLSILTFRVTVYFKNALYDISLSALFLALVFVAFVLLSHYSIFFPLIQFTILIILNLFFSLTYQSLNYQTEREFLRKILGRYVNSSFVDKLIENPSQLKKTSTKQMSVMFSDIRGFSSISENLSSSELQKFMNLYLGEMSKIIYSNHGTIDKFIGDAIMAFWDKFEDQKKNAYFSVKTAIEMQTAMANIGKKFKKLPKIKIGIGIATGEMTLGNVGNNIKYSFTVFGDSVNLSSRLESLTKKYGVQILIDAETYRKIRSKTRNVRFRLIDKVRVAGKDDIVEIYEPFSYSIDKKNIKLKYETGLKKYLDGDFLNAREIFKELSQIDSASQLMYQRTESFLEKGVEEEVWDGVWKWEEK